MAANRDTPSPPASPLGQVVATWLKLGVALALVGGVYAWRFTEAASDEHFFWTEDLPVLAAMVALAAGLRFAQRDLALKIAGAALRRPLGWTLGLAVLVLIVGVAGRALLFGDYVLSQDEFLGQFDAAIFGNGQLMAPTPAAWRDYLPALQPLFMLPTPGNAFEASAYLPLDAAFRALAGVVHAEAVVNPLWSAVSVVAVFGVGRRLWPERPGVALGAAALLATSSQLMLTAMTAYAMPAQLALNLVWLWLFLRGGWAGHLGAIVVAFVACGLHQLIFHPLFAAPFVLQLWLGRRWRVAGLYTLAYAAIGLFWVAWWPLELRLVGAAPGAAQAVGGGWLAVRVARIFAHLHLNNALGAMAEELLRFATWQSLLTAPLAVIAAMAAWRAGGHLRALVLGVALTLVAMFVLVPAQTHGWGYRYLHGLMGSICLLAAWGWARMTAALSGPAKPAATAAFVGGCAVSLLVLLPVRAWQAWDYVRPYAAANAAIQSAPTQVVIVDGDQPGRSFNPGALVRNDSYLLHGPKVMALAALTEPAVRQLCARYSVSIFDGQSAADFGIDFVHPSPDPDPPRLRALMERIGCGRRLG